MFHSCTYLAEASAANHVLKVEVVFGHRGCCKVITVSKLLQVALTCVVGKLRLIVMLETALAHLASNCFSLATISFLAG